MQKLPFLLSCDDTSWRGFIGLDPAIAALRGNNLLGALEERICAIEDAGLDSVGPSGIPDENGRHTLDAGIMTGWNHLSAGIACLEGFQNPFAVALALWHQQKEESYPHNFLAGSGAEAFARQNGAKAVQPSIFSKPVTSPDSAHDTVGCIVCDGERWAVGTSTSGWGGKKAGRVGDTPFQGSGFSAGPAGAAFCTWTGEIATRLGLAGRALHAIEMGLSLDQAVHFAFAPLETLADGHKGPVILHLVTTTGAAVVGVGFENDIVPATYSYWQEGMLSPERHSVPAWDRKGPVPIACLPT